jgi:hypothetical protein
MIQQLKHKNQLTIPAKILHITLYYPTNLIGFNNWKYDV